MLPSTESQTYAHCCKARNEWKLQLNSTRARIDRNHQQGLQSFKPEGEGETEANERSSQPYKPPVHGEEEATTAFK